MLLHAFNNTHSDGTDTTKTQPSNWNAEHVFSGSSTGALLYRDTGQSTGANWLVPGVAGYALISNGAGSSPSWNAVFTPAFPLAATAGGTGVANLVGSTITLGGSLTLSGAFTTAFTVTANTAVTLPTSGTLLSTASLISPSQGGTGVVNNAASTLTISGSFASTFTITGITTVTFPTSGTLATTAQIPTTPISPANGGTGVANNAANTLTFSGNFALAFTLTAGTSLTLPTSGTLLTTTGSGASLTALNATQLTSGTVPTARFPTTFTLTDGATPALDASQGSVFRLVAAGDRTIAVPTNPISGQKIIIQHLASGGARTLALNTGAGGFRFGTDIPSLSQTASGKTDYIGCVYNATDTFWEVVAVTKGF